MSLPPKTVERIHVDLAPRQRQLYEEMRDELAIWIQNLSGEQVLEQAENILVRLTRLIQLASNPLLLDKGYSELPAKFRALDEILPARAR